MFHKNLVNAIAITLISFSVVSVNQAGFLDKMKDKAVKKVKKQTENNIENKMDKKIEELIPSFENPEAPQEIQTDSETKSSFSAKPNPGVVAIYTTASCPYCKKAINWLKDNQVTYKEYDVQNHPKGKLDYKMLGGRGVPLILVGDEKMNGFSASNLRAMLKRDEQKRALHSAKPLPQENVEQL